MKTLILDYSTWRCGGFACSEPKTGLGVGATFLLNRKGYMCCLGQFSPQLNPEIKKEEMLGKDTPVYLKRVIPGLTYQDNNYFRVANTVLSQKAMGINDDNSTTVEEKIKKLKILFKAHGYAIRVINRPKK